MIKLMSLLKEEYLGNCIDLISQFGDSESTECAMWMQQILGDDDNIFRITKDVFFKYVTDAPNNAISGTDPEYYYIIDGSGHPNGNVNFVLYSTNKKGHDIHYFFDVLNDPKSEILSHEKLENGFGAGENM